MSLFQKRLTKREELNTTKTKRFRLGFLDSLNLYTRILADKITKGRTDTPEEKLGKERILGDQEFYYSVNRIFTNKGVKKPYFITLPKIVSRGFVTDLRENIDRAVSGYNQANHLEENVSVTCIADGENFKVDLSKGRMQGRYRLWARQYEKIMREAQDKKLEDELKSDKHTDETRHKVGSYLYMKEALEDEKSSFYKTTIILELVATSDEILNIADAELQAFFFQLEARAKEVFIQTNEYMRSYTPMVNKRKSLIREMNEGDVFADDTISSLSVPTHGIIGDSTGVYHGADVLSRRIVTIDMYNGTDANNILLTARTGEGKSQFAKMLYTFYSADPRFSTVVFDYEGSEYKPLANVIDAHIISLTGSSGKFVNTMVIGDLTGDPETDKNLKVYAQDATLRVFNLLVDEYDGMTAEQEAIFSDAMNQVYLDFGVTEDPSSWKNSKDITFFHIYMKIKEFNNTEKGKQMRDLHGREEINNFAVILRPYFEEGGLKKHWFRESISLQDILDKKHIVFSFGMGDKEEAMVDGKELALRQLFASHITTLLSNYNSQKGIKTVLFLEELQRYLKQRFSGEIIAKFVSGGRKNGLICYLITNSPRELINMEENLDDNIRNNASTIMSGISMYLIGSLLKKDMDALIDSFGIENAYGVLSQLTNIAENKVNNSGLKYCFYIRYRGQGGLVRMISHPAIEDLPLYKTVDMKERFKGEESSGEDEQGLRTVEHMDKDDLEKNITKAEEEDRGNQGKGFEYYRRKYKNSGIWNNQQTYLDLFKNSRKDNKRESYEE